MASFQVKIGLKRPRKRENNNYRSVPFVPGAKQKIPKKQKKIQKVKKYHYGLAEKQKKCKLSFRSVPTQRVIENSKKKAKKFKKLKNTIMASLQVETGWKRPRKREYKNYRSVSFQPDTKQKIQKKLQKNSKI